MPKVIIKASSANNTSGTNCIFTRSRMLYISYRLCFAIGLFIYIKTEHATKLYRQDYLKSRHLQMYMPGDSRYNVMVDYCRWHNKLIDYEPYFLQWTDEQMCNYALTLCHFIDKMMMSFLKTLEREFITEGGIKERMHKARTGYRQKQDEKLKQLEAECSRLEQALKEARTEAEKWKTAYNDLKQRALKAYYSQQEEIKRLKEKLGEGER